MKTHLLIFLSFALSSLLDCCICDDEPECCQPSKVTVEMAVRVQDADVVTRTTDESTIADINLFLRGPEGSQHLYSTAPTLRFACIPGIYTLYIIANAHANLHDLAAADLDTYSVDYRTDYDDLPMTVRRTITVPASAGTVRLPAIEIERAVAQVDYDIAVDKAVDDIVIRSVQAMYLPKHYRPFAGATYPSSSPTPHRSKISGRQQPSRVRSTCFRTARAHAHKSPLPKRRIPPMPPMMLHACISEPYVAGKSWIIMST